MQLESAALTGGADAVEPALNQLLTQMTLEGPNPRLLMAIVHAQLRLRRYAHVLLHSEVNTPNVSKSRKP